MKKVVIWKGLAVRVNDISGILKESFGNPAKVFYTKIFLKCGKELLARYEDCSIRDNDFLELAKAMEGEEEVE